MVEQVVAVSLEQAGPTVLVGNNAGWLVACAGGRQVRRLRPLIGHFEKQQIRQLLDVVAITHPVVTEDVAVIPKF